jgi:23S rRNA (cytosine1962-C5)-methyltransferase
MRNLLEKSVAQRQALLSTDTDAVRLIDGAGDGLPGLILETYAGRWLLSTTTGQTPPAPPPVLAWLRERGNSCYWKRLDQHQKESPALLCGPAVEKPFLIRENGLSYEISFRSGYSQGIFLDQRENRAQVRGRMRTGMRLLNTFAYTGAFSIAAASAGAETTTLDLAQPCLDWAKRNFAHNHLDAAAHHFCKGDTAHWLRRFAKQGRKFDGVVLDPPTFSRDEKGNIFRVEVHFGALAALAADILAPGGWLLCCTNFRRMSPREFERQIVSVLPRRMHPRFAAMPPDFTDAAYLKSLWLE